MSANGTPNVTCQNSHLFYIKFDRISNSHRLAIRIGTTDVINDTARWFHPNGNTGNVIVQNSEFSRSDIVEELGWF